MIRSRIVVAIFAFLAATPVYVGADDRPNKPVDSENIMQKKLVAAQKLLGALATNDFAAVKENAQRLNDYSKQAAWKLIETPRYGTYSDEFQRITLKMVRQAEDKNIDGVALAYVDLTLTCVKCHQYVRDTKMGYSPLPRTKDLIAEK